MQSGDLDQRIAIEVATLTTGSMGEEVESWLPDCHPWARVIETPGREFLKADFQAEEKAVFVIRWRVMDSRARVNWSGRMWSIESITGTRREGWAWLHCKSISGQSLSGIA